MISKNLTWLKFGVWFVFLVRLNYRLKRLFRLVVFCFLFFNKVKVGRTVQLSFINFSIAQCRDQQTILAKTTRLGKALL